MNNYGYTQQDTVSQFMYRVYGWMMLGLVLTAGVAYYIASVPGLALRILANPWIFFGLFIAQIGLVISLSGFIQKMSFAAALSCFLLYAASLGLTLSSVFLAYQMESIYITFLVAASMFGIMSLYGYFSRSDLTSIGNLSRMMLFGLILGLLINMFFKSPMMDYILSAVGVVVFTLLTAYDSQRIKQMAYHMIDQREVMAKVALLGALTLYLDFINLFLYLLQFMGKKKE